MAINPIVDIETSPDYQVFEFESHGKVTLRKSVHFDLIDSPENIYNLALCTILSDGTRDCESDTRNGDMDIVLQTTAYIGILYINKYPDRKVFLRGSDQKRSRKYQMGINTYLTHLSQDFIIEGLTIENKTIVGRELFKGSKNYQAFLFSKR